MKVILQRVKNASVTVNGEICAQIEHGLLLLLGIAETDNEEDIEYVSGKCINLRIFEDDDGKMNRSLLDVGGSVLVVSQFTLLGDTRKGRRPSFIEAASPEKGRDFYEKFVLKLKSYNINVQTGIFGAMMDVRFINYGPVTLMVESK